MFTYNYYPIVMDSPLSPLGSKTAAEFQLVTKSTAPTETDSPTEVAWRYDEAFSRNLGLVSPEDQQRLRNCCVAIPGMGGVGGLHLMTLARLGIGKFRVADSDEFAVANFNRQFGSSIDTLNQPKARVLAEAALQVNPDLEIEVFDSFIGEQNVDSFLDGVDLLIDAVDFFAFDARELLFREARHRNIWAVTAGPIGFSTAWLSFDPNGMSFNDYFDLSQASDSLDRFVAFALGLAPKATHVPYFDFSFVDRKSGRGPSVASACRLASGVVGSEAVKILLGKGPVRPAPHYHQFDPYRYMLKHGKLRYGNRGPIQKLKRRVMRSRMIQLGFSA